MRAERVTPLLDAEPLHALLAKNLDGHGPTMLEIARRELFAVRVFVLTANKGIRRLRPRAKPLALPRFNVRQGILVPPKRHGAGPPPLGRRLGKHDLRLRAGRLDVAQAQAGDLRHAQATASREAKHDQILASVHRSPPALQVGDHSYDFATS